MVSIIARRPALARAGAWAAALIASLLLAWAISAVLIAIALATPAYRGHALLAAGIKMFVGAVVWPGLVTACLIVGDGWLAAGLSRRLLRNAAAWGLIPPFCIRGLMEAGISWIVICLDLCKTLPFGILPSAIAFLVPSLVCAYLGRTLGRVRLRSVSGSDLPIFYEQQADAEANRMVPSVPRTRKDFLAHWAKTSADPAVQRKTILYGGAVAGYVAGFERLGKREVCYWLGKGYWGKGAATEALRLFLKQDQRRPIYARVAKRNLASLRVLKKCGFDVCAEERYTNRANEEIEEYLMILPKPA